MTLFNIYSKAAGWARALITLLAAVATFLGTLTDFPLAAQVSVYVVAAIQILTRFTGLGDKPPQLAPDVGPDPVPAKPAKGVPK